MCAAVVVEGIEGRFAKRFMIHEDKDTLPSREQMAAPCRKAQMTPNDRNARELN